MNRYLTRNWPAMGPLLLVALAFPGFASTIQAAGLVGSLASETFTPKNGTTRAQLEQTLLVKDDLPNNSAVLSWSTSTMATLADFLNEGGGNYYVDLTLHVRNQVGAAPAGLAFRRVGVELHDVAGLPLNGSDKLYFGAGATESTSFFPNPPVAGGMPPEDLVWKNGLLPASAPFTEATFKMLIHLDPMDDFGGNGQGNFSLEAGLIVETVPEPSAIILAICGLAGGAFWFGRKRERRPLAERKAGSSSGAVRRGIARSIISH